MNWRAFFFTIVGVLVFGSIGRGFMDFTFWLADHFGRGVGFGVYAGVIALVAATLVGLTASNDPNDTGPR